MKQPGLRSTLVLGWLCGVIFTPNPWKLREFKSWKSPYTVYASLTAAVLIFLIFDFLLNILNRLAASVTRHNLVSRNVFTGFLASGLLFFFILRVYFTIRAKSMSSFLVVVKKYDAVDMNEEIKRGRRRSGFLNIACLILTLIEAVLICMIWVVIDRSGSWFNFVPVEAFVALGFFTTSLPALLIPYTAFSLINYSTYVLLDLFLTFCSEMEKAIEGQREAVMLNELNLAYFKRYRSLGGKHMSIVGELMGQSKHEILQESFKDIQALFKKFDKIFGPLLLFLIVSSTLGTIQTLNSLLNNDGRKVDYRVHSYLTLFRHVIFLTVLDLGHRTRQMFESKNHALKELLLTSSKHTLTIDLVNLVHSINSWQWKMSAAGFFMVDRSLMGGIVSTMMTYIVILFQLQDRQEQKQP